MPDQGPGPLPLDLERYRGYLIFLARASFPQELRGKLDPSDVVQQTLLEAHQSRALFRGDTAAQQAAWMRRILLQNLVDAHKALTRQKRDLGRERSLEASLAESSALLEEWLAKEQTSPSDAAARQETALRLAEALASLPETEQEALLLRNCRGWSLEEIGQHLGVTRKVVARLLRQGIVALRERLKVPE